MSSFALHSQQQSPLLSPSSLLPNVQSSEQEDSCVHFQGIFVSYPLAPTSSLAVKTAGNTAGSSVVLSSLLLSSSECGLGHVGCSQLGFCAMSVSAWQTILHLVQIGAFSLFRFYSNLSYKNSYSNLSSHGTLFLFLFFKMLGKLDQQLINEIIEGCDAVWVNPSRIWQERGAPGLHSTSLMLM